MVRARSLFSLFAAALIAALPVHALAQEVDDSVSVRERPREEYDPLGMRFGGFNLHANLDLGVTSTDNLFAVETGEQDDIIYSVAPEAQLRSNWSRHALAFDAGAEFTSHDDFSSEDATTSFAGVFGRLDVGSRTEVSASARIANEVEPRTDPDALIIADPVEFTRTNFAASVQHTFNRLRLRGTYAVAEHDYDDAGAVDQDFRDNDERRLIGRLDAELTPRIGLVVEASTDERDYDNNPGLNSEGRSLLAGVSVNLTDLMRGEFTVGQFERDYDFGGTVEGTAMAGNLEWYVTRLTTLSFNASRSGEDGGAFAAAPFVETRYGARVDHEIQRNIILTAGVQMGRHEYEVIDRDDDYSSADVGVDYIVNRRVALRARFTRDELESDGVNRYRDYEVNRLSAGISLRL